jgi:uncharacterized membrane protein
MQTRLQQLILARWIVGKIILFNSPCILLFFSLATLIGYGIGRLKSKNIKSNKVNTADATSRAAD